MQLVLKFRFNNLTLPISNNHLIQGMIYNCLKSDRSYSALLHNQGFSGEGNQRFKFFVFDSPRGPYEIQGKTILYKNDVTLEVRSFDPYFIQLLFEQLRPGYAVRFGDNIGEIADARINCKTIFSDACTIQTLTPITVYEDLPDGKTRYFTPDEEYFYQAVGANVQRKWQTVFGNEPYEFFFAPEEEDNFKKQIHHFKGTIIEAYKGRFHMEGTPELLSFLYDVGLGGKNAQGFGMFEVVKKG